MTINLVSKGPVNDVICSECGSPMYLVVRRSPSPVSAALEDQTFRCTKCAHTASRTIDGNGNALNWVGL